jgi:hypothetical protein
MSTQLGFVIIGILFLVKIISGIFLTRSGRPFSSLLLTFHKLISLGTLVFVAITVNRLRGDTGLSPVEMTAVIVTGVLFLLTIVTGGLVSLEKPAPAAITIVHRLAPFVTTLATVATLYLVITT